jgi:hypothetical protein
LKFLPEFSELVATLVSYYSSCTPPTTAVSDFIRLLKILTPLLFSCLYRVDLDKKGTSHWRIRGCRRDDLLTRNWLDVLISFRRKRLGAVRPSPTRPALSENSTNKRKTFKKRLSRYLYQTTKGFNRENNYKCGRATATMRPQQTMLQFFLTA